MGYGQLGFRWALLWVLRTRKARATVALGKASCVVAHSQLKGSLLRLRCESRACNRSLHSISVESANWETERDCRREGSAE